MVKNNFIIGKSLFFTVIYCHHNIEILHGVELKTYSSQCKLTSQVIYICDHTSKRLALSGSFSGFLAKPDDANCILVV